MHRSIHQRLASVSVPIYTVAPPSDYDKHKTFHSFIDQRQRLAIVSEPINTVAPPSDYGKSYIFP